MIMIFEQLQDKIIDWAEDKGILDNSNPLRQLDKTQEELDETREALQKVNALEDCNDLFGLDKSKQEDEYKREVADGIGDMMVTIIILAELAGLDATDCLRDAYNEIKDRKGKMENGFFVKE